MLGEGGVQLSPKISGAPEFSGDPTDAAPGIWAQGEGHGFELTAPADRVNRCLRIYAGVNKGWALVRAYLTDGPTSHYGDITFSSRNTLLARTYVINYTAAAPRQMLKVEVRMMQSAADPDAGVMLQAVTTENAPGNTPPSVRIVSPKRNERLTAPATLTVEAEASDPDGVSKVEFFDASIAAKIGEATQPPYRITVDRPSVRYGGLCARAFDRFGMVAYSPVVHYTVETPSATQAPVARTRSMAFISPGDPDHGWEGVSSLVELPNGDLVAAWFAGKLELSPDSAIYMSWLRKGTNRWTPPKRMIDSPYIGDGNPVLFFHQGVLWCFYNKLLGPSIEFSKLYCRQSRDSGRTWGPDIAMPEPSTFRYQTGTLASTRPLVLQNSDILLPVNREAYDPEPSRQWYSLFLISSDGGKTWRESAPLYSNPGNIQPAVVQLSDGSLFALCRVRGQNRFLWQTTSRDNAGTWEPLQQSSLKSPSARVALVRLHDGKLVLAYNDSFTVRSPLNLTVSEDEGRTWTVNKAIESGAFAFTYPFAIVARDGKIHISYNDNYRAVKHAVVDESWFAEPVARGAPERARSGFPIPYGPKIGTR